MVSSSSTLSVRAMCINAGVRRALLVAVLGMLASTVASADAEAATIGATASCVYSGGSFAVFGSGFDPGTPITIEVVGTPPLAVVIAARSTVAGSFGEVRGAFDSPPAAGTSSRLYTIRARRSDDASATPAVLASSILRSVSRGLDVSSGAGLTAGTTQHWRLTGLPEGTRMYAHFRRSRNTVARRSLGTVADPCGRLSFDLRVLPRGHERRGRWEVWLTADSTFRVPRKGVYVRRSVTADGSSARARVVAGKPGSRLTPLDPRFSLPVTSRLGADATTIGLIDVFLYGARGSKVDFFERIGDRLVPLGAITAAASASATKLVAATVWSCERSERRFVATAVLPDGTQTLGAYSVRTPSCTTRFELSAPRAVQRGARATIRVVDTWGIGGIKPALCVTSPSERRACRPLPLPRAVTVAKRGLRPRHDGTWLVELRVGDRRVASTTVRVGKASRPTAKAVPTVLATGDSMMQGIDSFLADELGDTASVRSDVRPGSSLSRPAPQAGTGASKTEWERISSEQEAMVRPSAAVLSIGAGEGFPMTNPAGAKVTCCSDSWRTEYARRARIVMATYARARRTGRLLWLTIPLPRDEPRTSITRAVNDVLVETVPTVPGARLVRMDQVFSPDGYRDVIRYRGREVDVRDPDGVHLNVAGTAIAAKIVAEVLRAADQRK